MHLKIQGDLSRIVNNKLRGLYTVWLPKGPKNYAVLSKKCRKSYEEYNLDLQKSIDSI